jgi:hypothetical protein
MSHGASAKEGGLNVVERIRALVGRWRWAIVAVVTATLAVGAAFSTTDIFFLRDLATYFWPYHLWLRETILSGQLPVWDPFIAGGQSAVADPLRQVLFLPALLPRLLLPPVLGFNLTVALPFPLAALGCYLFARRHLSAPGAALTAIVFAVSGPVLSTGNFPNVSWSVAPVPWVLWAVDRIAERPTPRRVAVLALAVATQALSGESATMAATCAIAGAYALVGVEHVGSWKDRATVSVRTLYGIAAGFLLAAAQLVPLLNASSNSIRAGGFETRLLTFWSLHPAVLVETLVPYLYGDSVRSGIYASPWIWALNDTIDPCLFSVYLGVPSVALATFAVAVAPRRRWVVFWTIVFVVALVMSLGRFTPIYPALQEALVFLKSFRFPAKYFVFASLAVAALVGFGWDNVAAAQRRRGVLVVMTVMGLVTAAAAAIGVAVVAAPHGVYDTVFSIANAARLYDPVEGTEFLVDALSASALRLAVLAASTAGLVWLSASSYPRARLAPWILFVAIALDLLGMNYRLNPTTDATLLAEPPWVAHTRADPDARIYVGKRPTQAIVGPPDVDQPPSNPARELTEVTEQETRAAEGIGYALVPSVWRMREMISHDLDVLFPREYIRALRRFRLASRERRSAFLANTGVRYHFVAIPPIRSAAPLAKAYIDHPYAKTFDPPVTLYDVPGAMARASIVPTGRAVPDVTMQIETLFDATFDSSAEVLLASGSSADPGRHAWGNAGDPLEPSATIVRDTTTVVDVEAHVPAGGGFLVLLDSYDPFWRVEVDNEPATMSRANGLFRAVELAPGRHVVRFAYRPTPLYLGLAITAVTALLLALAFWKGGGTRARDLAGETSR